MTTGIHSHRFGTAFLNEDQLGLIQVLDGQSALPSYKRYKSRSIELLGLRSGMRCLEVGCGLGAETHAMAEIVAPDGEAIGIDPSEIFVNIAKERAPTGNGARFIVGDGSRLDFKEASFDAARIDRVLQHTPVPFAFISETHRVLTPSGRSLVVEPDWETFVINHPDRLNTRKLVNAWCDRYQNPWIGRELPGMFKRAGFSNITVEGVTLIYPTLEIFSRLFQLSEFARECLSNCREWLEALEVVGKAGEHFASVEMFMVVGRKAV